jgi:hypothetical protein
MATLVGKALFRIARALRLMSHLIGALATLALVASPFIASSFLNWLATALGAVAIAFGAWLILYVGLPNLLARWAIAILPAGQMHYAATELAIWNHEARHGPADAPMRSELRATRSQSAQGFAAGGHATGRPPNGRSAHMEFQTEAQRAFYDTMKGWVSQMFGESAWVDDEMPRFGCPVGGFNVIVGIQSVGDLDACADIWTWPVPDVQHPPDDALRFMLETNAQYRFGDLNLQADGSIVFEYFVQAGGLTKERFESLLYAVAGSASEIQAELATRLSA